MTYIPDLCRMWVLSVLSTLSTNFAYKLKVAGTVLKHANYSLLAVTTIMQYAHTYVHVAVRLPALRVINARVHVSFHSEAILPELAHPRYISRQAIREPVERQDRFWGLD